MAELPAFRAVALRDAVADALRRALLERRFSPGEALIESSIATQMKVSRGPVREALLLLMQEGLVTHSQNHGFAVLNFTPAERLAGEQVRLVLETLALQLAREQASETDLTELESRLDRMVSLLPQGDPSERLAEEIGFHTLIWRRSGNAALLSALQRVTLPVFTFVTAYQLNNNGHSSDDFREQHQLYIDYLRRRTTRTAEECVRYHLGFPAGPADHPPTKDTSLTARTPIPQHK